VLDSLFAVYLLEQVPVWQAASGNNPLNDKSGMGFKVKVINLDIPKESLIEFHC